MFCMSQSLSLHTWLWPREHENRLYQWDFLLHCLQCPRCFGTLKPLCILQFLRTLESSIVVPRKSQELNVSKASLQIHNINASVQCNPFIHYNPPAHWPFQAPFVPELTIGTRKLVTHPTLNQRLSYLLTAVYPRNFNDFSPITSSYPHELTWAEASERDLHIRLTVCSTWHWRQLGLGDKCDIPYPADEHMEDPLSLAKRHRVCKRLRFKLDKRHRGSLTLAHVKPRNISRALSICTDLLGLLTPQRLSLSISLNITSFTRYVPLCTGLKVGFALPCVD